ncbi:MAG: glycosyltransferase family 2 protein [Myxococcales bacterium]|nr:glycosyltransferase family 2 protein [Myxococcales bacterium]MCB9535880.1 glycosyltransferase family 2 protein [Myxococcales bacterium]
MGAPDVSIVIPVYNEEGIISASLSDLREKLQDVDFTYEIIVAENGSTDATVRIAEDFSTRHPEVRVMSIGEPNYGKALRRGILEARGKYVICDEIDLCDVDFYRVAMEKLREDDYDLVVGSKRAPGARDRRPAYRRMATQVLNGMLRVATGFKGTDTHGLKAFERSKVLHVVEACVVDRDMFASELVVRAHRDDRVKWCEVPIDLVEKRPPSVHLFRRVPNVLKNMVRLTSVIRFGRDLK